MAKLGTVDHPKTKALAKLLNINQGRAVGILECLWHFASERTRDGGIGKYDDATIAREVFWTEEGEAPSTLVAALLKSGWLDENNAFGLYIHDWHDHCPDFVHMSLARTGEVFANGQMPSLRRLSQETQSRQLPVLQKVSNELKKKLTTEVCAYMRTTKPSLTKPNQAKPSHINSAHTDPVRTAAAAKKTSQGGRQTKEKTASIFAEQEPPSLDLLVPPATQDDETRLLRLENQVIEILTEVPNFAIRPPSAKSIAEIVVDFGNFSSDTILRSARHARDWALGAPRYADNPKKVGNGASYFRAWLTRDEPKILAEQKARATSSGGGNPERKNPCDGLDYVLKRVDGEVMRVIPGSITPFDEEEWRKVRASA